MKIKDILSDLSKVEQLTTVSIAPGPAVISAGVSDAMAAKLLLWLYEQLPEEATSQDLHDVLDAAKWWTTFLESVRYAETRLLTPRAGGQGESSADKEFNQIVEDTVYGEGA